VNFAEGYFYNQSKYRCRDDSNEEMTEEKWNVSSDRKVYIIFAASIPLKYEKEMN
jgi:hypothetical protein